MRLFLDSSQYVAMVRHLYKGANHVQLKTLHNTTQSACDITIPSTSWEAEEEKRIIKNSALYSCEQRHLTCGTHFEETKLVASITGRPAPESMSISWIFTPVGTISWGTMELKQLELALMGGGNAADFVPTASHVRLLHSTCLLHNFCGQDNQRHHRCAAKRWWSGDR